MIERKFLVYFLTIFFFSVFSISIVNAESQVCAVYFTGIGCPHCANADPVVLDQLPKEYEGQFVVIEYEVYQKKENAPLIMQYNSVYNSGLGIPLVIFNKDDYLIGDRPILDNIESKIDDYLAKGGNDCPLIDGSSVSFNELDVPSLPGTPQIWLGNETYDQTNTSQGTSFIWIIILVPILLVVGSLILFKKIKIKIKT